MAACACSTRPTRSHCSSNRPAEPPSTAFNRILDIAPQSLHMRTPLIFGSKDKVERIAGYYRDSRAEHEAPLFARRGLLRR